MFWQIWQTPLNVIFQMLEFFRNLSYPFVFFPLCPMVLILIHSSLSVLSVCYKAVVLEFLYHTSLSDPGDKICWVWYHGRLPSFFFSLLSLEWPPCVWRISSVMSLGGRHSKPFTLETENVRYSVFPPLLQPEFRHGTKARLIRWALHILGTGSLKKWGLWGTLWKHDSGCRMTTFLAPPSGLFRVRSV